jgi:predicted amidophosphoribosyltransferase
VRLLDLLLPMRCAVCGTSGGEQLCDACREALPRLRPPFCDRCGLPTAWPVGRCRECSGRPAFARARSAVAYDESVRRLVAAWKERGLRRLAAEAADLVAESVPQPDVVALAFVPSDHARALQRGDHPAARLARELGVRWSLPALPLIARAHPVSRQRGLSLADRRRNVAGAFRPAAKAPPRVALIDDVYTSGATATAAASALRRAGAWRVEVVTFARVVR